MLLAGMVSSADILPGLLIFAGIWLIPPLLYSGLIWTAVFASDHQPRWGLLGPVVACVFGLPLLIYALLLARIQI